MSIYDEIKINTKLPIHCDYSEYMKKIEFWSESVEVDEDYWSTISPNGQKTLIKFTCESSDDFKWRMNASTPKNIVGPILGKYLSTCFKNQAQRVENDFFINVDLLGSNADEFFEQAAKQALIEGVSYIMPDSTSSTISVSEAQKEEENIQPFLRLISAENVKNWLDFRGNLQEIIIEFEDIEGYCYYMYYDNTYYARIDINEAGLVTKKSELIPHNYSRIPVVRLMPFDTEESFVAPGAMMQMSVNNLSSLEKLEIYKATFTKYFAKGFELQRDEKGNIIPLNWGTERFMHVESKDGDIKTLGADTAQADSIRKSIEEETATLWKQYHLQATQINDISQSPSGYALVISRADFNSICAKIIKAVEKAENDCILLLSESEELPNNPTKYSREFIDQDKSEAILNLRDILSLPELPQEIKDKEIEMFKTKFYKG